jgi:hypothetical protein
VVTISSIGTSGRFPSPVVDAATRPSAVGESRLRVVWSSAIMSRVQVIWLYGTPGVGKSTAGWALMNGLAVTAVTRGQPAYVDIDQLGMLYPAPPDDPWADGLKVQGSAPGARRY